MYWCKLIVVIVAFIPDGQGFVFNSDNCPVSAPCRCYGSSIKCASVRLTAIPSFNFTKQNYRYFTIDLRENNITNVSANAFNNIQVMSPVSLEIRLQDNRITSIDDNAFSNIENVTLTLDLSNNNLRTLPHAFLKTKKLQELRLLGNPIVFLDHAVMNSLQQSLKHLMLGMKEMVIWPQEFQILSSLNELIVDEIPFHSLPSDAFHGLSSLTRLEITKAKLERMPEDLCALDNMYYFKFSEDSSILNDNQLQGLFKTCGSPPYMKDVTSVFLSNDFLFSFPSNVFRLFPNLRRLDLSFNNIDYINEDDVPSLCRLYDLYLSNNQFINIPSAVSKMQQLKTLIISNNKITRIDDLVLSSLTYLEQLTISGNPLTYIDPHAFSSLNHLGQLYVENTNLTAIPAAILHSARRFSITTSHSPIQCTCNTMFFLKAWPLDEIRHYKSFYGNCDGNRTMSIRSYLYYELPHCL